MVEHCGQKECDYWDADYDQYCKAKGGQVRIAPFCDDYKPYTVLKVQKMDDEEFYTLQRDIDMQYMILDDLQKKYRKETGRDFVRGQPYERKPDKGER